MVIPLLLQHSVAGCCESEGTSAKMCVMAAQHFAVVLLCQGTKRCCRSSYWAEPAETLPLPNMECTVRQMQLLLLHA
jgi:hypothetical protein